MKNGGTSTVRAPSFKPFDFDIKPHKTEFDDKTNNLNEDLTIKIKLVSKQNPNFIRILGRVDINLHKLVNKDSKQKWFELHNNKDVVNFSSSANNILSVGKIKVAYTFYETSTDSASKD
jgi:hypothetical protein